MLFQSGNINFGRFYSEFGRSICSENCERCQNEYHIGISDALAERLQSVGRSEQPFSLETFPRTGPMV